MPNPIHFIDLAAQQARIRDRIDAAIKRVLDHGQYIMGPEVAELERQLSAFTGAKHCISCANGTDALALGLMALGVKPGDAVLVPSFTFCATAEVVPWLGAVPVFVDVLEDTFNMNPSSLKAGIATAKKLGLRPVGVIPVDLFGQPADYNRLQPIADENGLWMLCDAAQSFGATYKGRRVGTLGRLTTTSFFPAKPLGCYGDGGAVFTDDDELAAVMRSLRVHGQGRDKYDNVRLGMNARLDTLQAAILLEKLAIFPDEISCRNRIAAHYSDLLKDMVDVPTVAEGLMSVWAQYTIRCRDRDRLTTQLKAAGVPNAVYYTFPLHRQIAYRSYPIAEGSLQFTDLLANEVLSLPMHGYLDEAAIERIVAAIDALG